MKIESLLPIEFQSKMKSLSEPVKELGDKEQIRDAALRKKSKELEAVFLTQLIKSMEKTVPEGLNGGKSTLSTMMFGSVMGDAMTEGGGIGLSKMIFNSFKKMDDIPDLQEVSGNAYMQTMNVMRGINTPEVEK